MVRIVIDDGDAPELSQALEAPTHPRKLPQSLDRGAEVPAKCTDHCERGNGVFQVVQAWHLQLHCDPASVPPSNAGLGAIGPLHDIADTNVGSGIYAEAAHFRLDPCADSPGPRI